MTDSKVALAAKNLPANARDVRDAGSIPWVGKIPSRGAAHSSIHAWKIPCIEESGRLLWQATVHRVARSRT